jgi:hypothetical protein
MFGINRYREAFLRPYRAAVGVKPSQAEARAKFPRPFGPHAEPKSLGYVPEAFRAAEQTWEGRARLGLKNPSRMSKRHRLEAYATLPVPISRGHAQ